MAETLKMKILITGSSGFIASKVKEKLISLGHEVVNFDILNSKNLLSLADVEESVKQVDVVYHLAAEADLTRMTDLNGAYNGVMINVQGTHNVAYACVKYSKWLIYASTVCVYGNQIIHPETEDMSLPAPAELYACSKYAGEWIIKGYAKNFGIPFTILRFATIYGEGMRKALGLHVFFRQALKGEPITVHGDGKQVRTLTYIHDLVEGIIAPLANPESKGHIINLSSAVGISALQMALDVKKITNSLSEIKFIGQRNNQTFSEDFDTTKARLILDWKAKTKWEDGLLNTYNWIKQCEK